MNAYPRIAIHFCTGCKWNLRAAWYLQELLSTFGNQLGEVALLPASSGTFIVEIVAKEGADKQVLWDRSINGGFPDSKDLKKLVRDVISPKQDLGHIDGHKKENSSKEVSEPKEHVSKDADAGHQLKAGAKCVDCQSGAEV